MPVSVLVVDDSSTVRTLLSKILQTDPQISVCGTAADGETALSMAQSSKPDVIALDLNMPGLNGDEVTRKIMAAAPVPIVIVTSDEKSTSNPFTLLEAGAVAVLPKPGPPGHPNHKDAASQLIRTVKALKGKRPLVAHSSAGLTTSGQHKATTPLTLPSGQITCIGIGASTGGPMILKEIVESLPADFPIPILITQHISKGFTASLVNWLKRSARVQVKMAVEGEQLQPGHVYFSPDDIHMGITPQRTIQVCSSGREYGMRPAISYMFRSMERACGGHCIAVLLTGMGRDGAIEMAALRKKGALTIAQDRETSLIHGMPGEAIACGGAAEVLPPDKIIDKLLAAGANSRRQALNALRSDKK